MIKAPAKLFLFFLLVSFICIIMLRVIHLEKTDGITFKGLMELSDEELEDLRKCAPEDAAALQELRNTANNIICTLPNERKHSIALLSSFPNSDSHVRSLYEQITGYRTFSPEKGQRDESHTLACTFQSGPWELYCRGNSECLYEAPDWDIPFLVTSNFPIYQFMCNNYGYDLPTHDRVIHIVRNPIGAIASWGSHTSNMTIDEFIPYYHDWHSYWRSYEIRYPDIPVMWVRHEDLCVCPDSVVKRILQAASIPSIPDTYKEVLQRYECDIEKDITFGMDLFTIEQLEYISSSMADILSQFGYTTLLDTMKDSFNANPSPTPTLLHSIYPLIEETTFCDSIASHRWFWHETIGA